MFISLTYVLKYRISVAFWFIPYAYLPFLLKNMHIVFVQSCSKYINHHTMFLL
ncbi:hypothetical protein BDF19DRAFT_429474 [Syncephalis fuscata]|nr:hypothetical protein BDF19DRAFT_429474 [Syncephalis fuscata]